MPTETQERLNKIRDRVNEPNFLNNKGLGNEIGFYVFDYPPEDELIVRDGVETSVMALSKAGLRIQVVNLFTLVIGMLEKKKLIDKVMKIESKQGSERMLSKLAPMIKKEKVAAEIVNQLDPKSDAIFLTGIGNIYPMIRSHEILNNLHAYADDKPLVVFFQGVYDMQSLKLFNCLPDNNYYRAFRLVP